jgi:polysaccharide export outer membrane protein
MRQFCVCATLIALSLPAPSWAQTAKASDLSAAAAGVAVPADYVIGPEDVLGVLFWREPDLSGDVTVRPDGKITLSLIGDVVATGLKPEALRDELQKAGSRFLADANVTVVVRQINSRKVFITGQVAKPGSYPLTGGMTVVQLIALAGGLSEYADRERITLVRGREKRPDGTPWSYQINYIELMKRIRLNVNNLELKPGDTLMVP